MRKSRNNEDISEGEQPEEPIYATVDKMRKSRNNEDISEGEQPEEPIYATVDKTRKSRNNEDISEGEQPEEPIYATVDKMRKSSNEREIFIRTLERDLLLSAHQQQIRDLCGIVYNNPLVFESRLQFIKLNPSSAERLMWDVANSSRYVPTLAGKKILGFRTKARVKAEENLDNLHSAIDSYGRVVQKIKDNMLNRFYDSKSKSSKTVIKVLQESTSAYGVPSVFEMNMKDIERQLVYKIPRNPDVQQCQTALRYWCNVVFGNPFILEERIEDLQKKPEMAEELSWQLKEHPGFFCKKLAGFELCGLKSHARQKAEKGIDPLCKSVENYGAAVKRAKEKIVLTHNRRMLLSKKCSDLGEKLQRLKDMSTTAPIPGNGGSKNVKQQKAAGQKVMFL